MCFILSIPGRDSFRVIRLVSSEFKENETEGKGMTKKERRREEKEILHCDVLERVQVVCGGWLRGD
jgi:hypothetical protein